MALESRVVSTLEEAARWQVPWRELLARSACDEPTRSPTWLLSWWRVFGSLDGRKLRLVLFFSGDRLVGVAPLLARRAWYLPGLPFRRLELLGTGEPEADEICSDHLGIVAERGQEAAVAEALAGALVSGRLGAWDEIVLSATDDEDPVWPPFERALREAGVRVDRATTGACPYIALPGSFDEYLASLRGEQRYLVRRAQRDFERWAANDAELHAVNTRAELDAGKRVLHALHAERWGANGKRGVFAAPRFRAFHDMVMEELFDAGALELFWLSVRGRPIAVAYNLIWNGKVHFYQSGRTLDVPKGIRPGIVLHARAIRRAIDAGLREYDFLAGTSRYKLDLATSQRPVARLRAARPSLREKARAATERGVARLRELERADPRARRTSGSPDAISQ